ncbi:hypothetical protein B7P43_G14021, partial [Cryptotermes secundus]
LQHNNARSRTILATNAHIAKFRWNDAVFAAVRMWLASAVADFYGRGIQALVHRWQNT